MRAQEFHVENSSHAFEGDIARTKFDFQNIADHIKVRYTGEDQIILRVQQVQAAIQRLEWALERALEVQSDPYSHQE